MTGPGRPARATHVTGRAEVVPVRRRGLGGEDRGADEGDGALVAVVCTRDGDLPPGGAEALAEAGGHGVVVEVGTGLRPGRLARLLAPRLAASRAVVCPASADGRDLAPRLAVEMGRPLLTGALVVEPDRVVVARHGGLVLEDVAVDEPVVTTFQPGVRGIPEDLVIPEAVTPDELAASPVAPAAAGASPAGPEPADARVEAVVTASTAELDLAEADRVLGVGAGLGDERFVALAAAVATALDLCLGATRVVTDHGWLPVERQIGTTGVEIRPRIYVAFGISGAVQHVAGLGDPDHVVSVNLDGSCPMAAMAELNLVADARAVLVALADRLGVPVDPDLCALVDVGGTGPTAASSAPAASASSEEHL